MKRLILLLFLLTQTVVFASYNDMYIVDIKYDWIDKQKNSKEEIITEIKDIVFDIPVEIKSDLKAHYSDIIKDKNYKDNYYTASAGHNETKDYNITPYYYKKMKNIYMYSIQYKDDKTKKYYYDALGNLKYIDFLYGTYPEYPYYTIQYKINGTPTHATYYVSEDCQYEFKPDGEFEGVWYKHNQYDLNSNIIKKRTNY